MALSTAVSVAAFSAVLAESFAAVAASTLIPATFLSVARAAKRANSTDEEKNALGGLLDKLPGASASLGALKAGAALIDDIDLLVPKTAKIHGEFTFEASERYSADVAVGALVNVVAVAAAYSALYETSSTNKITIDVDFAAVNYTLG